jgi:hypothetical protein
LPGKQEPAKGANQEQQEEHALQEITYLVCRDEGHVAGHQTGKYQKIFH